MKRCLIAVQLVLSNHVQQDCFTQPSVAIRIVRYVRKEGPRLVVVSRAGCAIDEHLVAVANDFLRLDQAVSGGEVVCCLRFLAKGSRDVEIGDEVCDRFPPCAGPDIVFSWGPTLMYRLRAFYLSN
jgi:hypothetical protein